MYKRSGKHTKYTSTSNRYLSSDSVSTNGGNFQPIVTSGDIKIDPAPRDPRVRTGGGDLKSTDCVLWNEFAGLEVPKLMYLALDLSISFLDISR